MNYLIVGGVAAGTKAAAKIKRCDRSADVRVITRDADISYAGCGLPYYIGGGIATRDELIVNTPAKYEGLTGVHVETGVEATGLDAQAKLVSVRRADGTVGSEPYDKLVIATGAAPFVPPVAGTDLAGVFCVRTPRRRRGHPRLRRGERLPVGRRRGRRLHRPRGGREPRRARPLHHGHRRRRPDHAERLRPRDGRMGDPPAQGIRLARHDLDPRSPASAPARATPPGAPRASRPRTGRCPRTSWCSPSASAPPPPGSRAPASRCSRAASSWTSTCRRTSRTSTPRATAPR